MREYIVTEKELGSAHDYFAELFNARELIRCKDCVHFKKSKVLGNTCALTDNHVTRNDFCSRAERKEE